MPTPKLEGLLHVDFKSGSYGSLQIWARFYWWEASCYGNNIIVLKLARVQQAW